MKPKEVLEFAKKNQTKQLDLRFSDITGLQHHVSYPITELSEDSFQEGFGMDGSSIRGWAAINESDMLLIPDASTAFMDPFFEIPTLVMVCDVIDPITRQNYNRDPRWIARKAELYLKNTGVGDTAYFGAEEGRWNSGRDGGTGNLGYRPRYKEGYFPVPPTDHYQSMRGKMVETMIQCGMNIECDNHEVATGGESELDQHFVT